MKILNTCFGVHLARCCVALISNNPCLQKCKFEVELFLKWVHYTEEENPKQNLCSLLLIFQTST